MGAEDMKANGTPRTMLPLQVTSRGLELPTTAESWIRAEAAKLGRFYPRIMGCRVAVASPHRHHRLGSRYHIRIDLTVPGGELVIKHEPSLIRRARAVDQARVRKQQEVKRSHKNLRLAIGDAFKAAARRLEDYARRQRGDTKSHQPPSLAQVSRLFATEGYGFLSSDDGRDVYFHRNSVLDGGFSRLRIGTKVRFVEESGEKGPQASTVVPI
ncbi:MAG: cold shock domain-containing protein [Terriglobales bacterium]